MLFDIGIKEVISIPKKQQSEDVICHMHVYISYIYLIIINIKDEYVSRI